MEAEAMGAPESLSTPASPPDTRREMLSTVASGTQVHYNETACRVTVKIVEAVGFGKHTQSATVKVAIEDTFYRTSKIKTNTEDDVIPIHRNFLFDVKRAAEAELSVRITARNRRGGWRVSVGVLRCIAVADLLNEAAVGGDNKPVLYDLYSKDGRRLCNRKILMEVHAARAEPQMRITSFITTWNVGQSPPPNDLSPWLPTDSQHELVVVGSQECEYSPPAPYATCGQHWVASLRAHFGELYKVVRATSRGQMRLVVLVREDVEGAISDVDAGSEATGLGHVLANKGALCISLKFWDTSLCFVNSHLAAHDGQCDARNSNYREIIEQTKLGFAGADLLSQFHHVVWMGDLNYRLDYKEARDELKRELSYSGHFLAGTGSSQHSRHSSLSLSEPPGLSSRSSSFSRPIALSNAFSGSSMIINYDLVNRLTEQAGSRSERDLSNKLVHEELVQMVKADDLLELLAHDELSREMAEGRAFCGFQEGPITFPPTFKVKKGTETEYLDKRFPAWCDRILWRSLPGCAASLKSYQSCPQVLTSDHKPVRAVLELMTFALPIEHFSEAHRGRDKDSHKRWHIRFLSLRGCNLKAADANGLSDPYVIFCGPNLLRPAKTSVKTKTLNPVWEPSEVPRLVLGLKSLMRVEKDYILFSVFDKDFASADDHLGYGVIPLAEAVDAHFRGPSETARFKTLLMLAGIPVGTLEGEIRLSWEPDEDSDRSATWHPLEALQQQAAQLRLLVKNWRTSSKSDYVGLQLQHAHRQPSTGGGV